MEILRHKHHKYSYKTTVRTTVLTLSRMDYHKILSGSTSKLLSEYRLILTEIPALKHCAMNELNQLAESMTHRMYTMRENIVCEALEDNRVHFIIR